jgi:DNA repair protein RecN (Recombination protein N)
MLSHLAISNYALIDKLEMSLPAGLTTITGETGAGKSILLGALGLILGQRADSAALQDKTKKCTVEATFQLEGAEVERFFREHDLDFDKSSVIRREITSEGKSRAFINDTPVNLNVLKELGTQLIDIHSQHETLTLNDSGFQLSVLDVFAKNEKPLQEYLIEYKIYREQEAKLKQLVETEAASKRDLDYFRFQWSELEESKLEAVEQEKLESEQKMLEHTEEIKSNLTKAGSILNGGEENLLSGLSEVRTILQGLTKYNPDFAVLAGRLNGAFLELKDLADEMETRESDLVYDPERVGEVTALLDGVYRLFQKHQVKTVSELIQLRDSLSLKLEGISSLEVEIAAIRKSLLDLHKKLVKRAGELALRRKEASPHVEKEIMKLLRQLGMPDAVLRVECLDLPPEQLNHSGMNLVNFLFSANKGSDPKTLNKVASGGELSRLMLSIKSLVATQSDLRTIIFDEIDTGVSGDVADKVGQIMEQIASSLQVITITHLPQIASKGNSHLFVFKETRGPKTYSQIKVLDKQERIQEIAKMLSTGTPGPAALKNAKELLSS